MKIKKKVFVGFLLGLSFLAGSLGMKGMRLRLQGMAHGQQHLFLAGSIGSGPSVGSGKSDRPTKTKRS